MMALAASIFAGACLLVVAAGSRAGTVYPALLVASMAVGVGECFYTTVLTPLFWARLVCGRWGQMS